MYRPWFDDTEYIFGQNPGIVHTWLDDVKIKYTKDTPAYTAPDVVYVTSRSMGVVEPSKNLMYNLTWLFPVDSGFRYLVRLHFCEIEEKDVTGENQRVFFIFINNITAEIEADVIHWTGGNDIPVYKDYVVMVTGNKRKQHLWLALHPNVHSNPKYNDAILSGIEIFKLNNSDGNLAGLNPESGVVTPSQLHPLREKAKKKLSSLAVAIFGAVLGAVFAISLFLYFCFKRRKNQGEDTNSRKQKTLQVPSLPTDLCHRFSIAEIRSATRNFDDQNVIGRGGFGYVYKGYIGNQSIEVAMKRLHSSSRQGRHEFQTEIEMLSKLRHVHLVSLIGYCNDENEMILVYEYMPHGTLQDHIYETENSPLPWKQRLQICIGAARGLHYLHTGLTHTIIHRDVKPSNILLDKNWVAKVSDFGLSRIGPTSEAESHVSTVVKGSFGYLDPEYYRRQQLTEKSDVYSFGVVLLEVLCARPPIKSILPKEQVSLVEWTRNSFRNGTLDQIIDQQLKGDITSVSLNKFWEIAESCLGEKAIDRPTMGDVIWSLEFSLQLHETAEKNVNMCDSVSENQKSSSLQFRKMITTDDDDDVFTFSSGQMSDSRTTVTAGKSTDSENLRSGTVFSELMNPHAR